jgi:HK97 family phage prohead protease
MAEVLDKVQEKIFTSWEFKAIEPPTTLDGKIPENAIYIEGYANTTTKDRVDDVVAAWNWSEPILSSYMKNGFGTLLFMHDHDKPVGKILEVEGRDDGLFVRGFVSKSWKDAWMVEEGLIKGFSIGYLIDWMNSRYDAQTDTYYLAIKELLEISIVTIPANQDSLISSIKSLIPKASNTTKTMKNLFAKLNSFLGLNIPDDATEEKAIEALEGVKTLKAQIDADELKTMVAAAVAELGLKKIDDSAFAEKSVVETLKGTVEAQAKTINDLAAELAGKKLEEPKPGEGNAKTGLSKTEKAFGQALKATVKVEA